MTEIDYGDEVLILPEATTLMRPNSIGAVCGFRFINSIELANEFGAQLGSRLILVEFSDGEAMEIPEYLMVKKDPIR